MKKRYYEFLNVLVTDCNPIRNLDFYKAGLIELFFISLVSIVSEHDGHAVYYWAHRYLVASLLIVPKVF